MNTWQNIIKKRMQDIGETQESLAEKLSVTQGSIAHWLSGRRKPDTDVIASILKAVGIKEITINADGSAAENKTQNKNNKNNFQIEVLDITASAGAGYLNSDVKEVIKLIEYDSEQAKILFKGIDSNNLKVINISGDSMQGTFESGDSIYVDISKKEFNGDGIYVFTFGKSLYVKRLQIIKDKLIVISDNKKYKEWDISEDEIDQLYIHGKVMLSQSMLLRKHG
ncbi:MULTISPECIES: LexA family transcriptional regulator [unclassified Gilliamella]|uniref:LexA family transcriptional regulator n=1 Tax=unclassified Gilliamella TaxID=2685620 RepID=UPI00226AB6CA|nr:MULTISPECIES: XRE family transcriptional regulator [unclassified Gilliamella]MCX8641704.1 helix-turn-helix transcriptional regulator [Gilliamella sp. B3835]MCX8706505.1 helix-turn-helix transcriptional regulator [Gilliamella sp. B3783]MCX8709152.1 helix-turn-helix transcriptional regulator [Gilliamella sp. B3780]MCX8714524.1 helix-turn-helix transcriptional regulator [Gilliamella sp. B3781]MCX8715891.1 helix-turn-helix transcriptional regulator [Gilliamella sp. B3784]